MNTAEEKEILDRAATLSDSARATIAAKLIASLPGSDYDVSDEEMEERRRQLASGEAEEITFEQLKAGLGR